MSKVDTTASRANHCLDLLFLAFLQGALRPHQKSHSYPLPAKASSPLETIMGAQRRISRIIEHWTLPAASQVVDHVRRARIQLVQVGNFGVDFYSLVGDENIEPSWSGMPLRRAKANLGLGRGGHSSNTGSWRTRHRPVVDNYALRGSRGATRPVRREVGAHVDRRSAGPAAVRWR